MLFVPDALARSLSDLLALVKLLREDIAHQRQEIVYLRMLLENCAGCKEPSGDNHIRVEPNCRNANPCYPGKRHTQTLQLFVHLQHHLLLFRRRWLPWQRHGTKVRPLSCRLHWRRQDLQAGCQLCGSTLLLVSVSYMACPDDFLQHLSFSLLMALWGVASMLIVFVMLFPVLSREMDASRLLKAPPERVFLPSPLCNYLHMALMAIWCCLWLNDAAKREASRVKLTLLPPSEDSPPWLISVAPWVFNSSWFVNEEILDRLSFRERGRGRDLSGFLKPLAWVCVFEKWTCLDSRLPICQS